VVVVSADPQPKQERFRVEIGAQYSFIPDSGLELIRDFGVKMPLVSLARRVTFVIGRAREVLWIGSGRQAIDPTAAIAALARY
jgi:peroxiredoxin